VISWILPEYFVYLSINKEIIKVINMDNDKMYQDLMPILLSLEGMYDSRPSSRLLDSIDRLRIIVHRVANLPKYYNK
jgi:hypothetical protein